jgi:DNA-binding FadR family transcriptional regulator
VREALKLLSAKGLIDSRKRAGTRARPREDWHMLDADVLAWRLVGGRAEPKFVADLLHLRAIVEPAAAAMAARGHTRKTLKAIETAYAEMECAAHDALLYADPDLRFHKAILATTSWPRLVR